MVEQILKLEKNNIMDIDTKAENIKSKEEFEVFLNDLKRDFESNKEDWENNTLSEFLEALAAYGKDIDGYYQNMNIPFNRENPTWKVFAEILLGAKVYE
mgnify:CR=1 FL=1